MKRRDVGFWHAGDARHANMRLARNRHASAIAAYPLLRDQRIWLGRGSRSELDCPQGRHNGETANVTL